MTSVTTYAIMREMPEVTNLADKMENQLPAELVNFMRVAGGIATKQGQSLYLVGGVVRDLLLGKANFDLDLVIEGNAIELAQQLAEIKLGKMTTHPQFNTAKIKWSKWSVDLATARAESYAKPGALPTVKPSSIESDLSRRDFTINTMAVCLNPNRYGELIDLYGGRDDLERRLIRILHERSFIDDATRIWRGVRYEQRLDFQMERNSLELLRRDTPMLGTISGDRIRYELECVFQEQEPEKVLRRAEELNVLQRLHPWLRGNGWLADKFKAARKRASPGLPPFGFYIALLAYHLSNEQSEHLISYLRLSKAVAQIVRDTAYIKTKLKALADPELSRSSIYRLLHSYSQPAIIANLLASESPVACQHIEIFLSELRYVKSALNGNDLIKMGVPTGPYIKEILQRLHQARLDRKVTSKQGEEELVKGWIAI